MIYDYDYVQHFYSIVLQNILVNVRFTCQGVKQISAEFVIFIIVILSRKIIYAAFIRAKLIVVIICLCVCVCVCTVIYMCVYVHM